MELLSVIGSGTMGHSITLNAAWAGIKVKMYGLSDEDTNAGVASIRKKLNVLQIHGLIAPGEVVEILERVTAVSILEEVIENATFVLESIPEDIVLKNKLFRQLDVLCGPEVILASNTSGLQLSDIIKGTIHQGRIVITHFWNPAHLIPLVEVLRSPATDEHVFQRTMSMLKIMGKKPIDVKKEVPGLVGNRLQFALFREAQYLLAEGVATKEDIDAAVSFSIGRRLSVTGPLMSADMGGLDVFNSVSNNLFKSLSNAEHSFPGLEELVNNCKNGEKAGEGYYEWNKEFSEKMNKLREDELIRFLKADKLNISSKT